MRCLTAISSAMLAMLAATSGLGGNQLEVKIAGKTFVADLVESDTAAALLARLPLTVTMTELNGNEKYYYLDAVLPTHTEKVGTIQAGDILLWGDDCLVLFYKSFSTPYSYTRIGRIADPDGLAEAAGTGSVSVTFSRRATPSFQDISVYDGEAHLTVQDFDPAAHGLYFAERIADLARATPLPAAAFRREGNTLAIPISSPTGFFALQ